MFKDNTSEIPETGCNVYRSKDLITNRSGSGTTYYYKDYYLIGDSWVKTRDYTSRTEQYLDYTCIDPADLPSVNSGFVPVYYFLILVMGLAVVGFVYRLIFGKILKYGL